MSEPLIPDYYSLNQLCKKWDFNLSQVHHVITKCNSRLWGKIVKEIIVWEEEIVPEHAESEKYEVIHDGFVELCKYSGSARHYCAKVGNLNKDSVLRLMDICYT